MISRCCRWWLGYQDRRFRSRIAKFKAELLRDFPPDAAKEAPDA